MRDLEESARDELALKQPLWTGSVVEARLRDTFAVEDRHATAVFLSGLMGEDPGGDPEVSDLATCRLMLAAIRMSEGDLARLSLWVEAARMDPRDLIAAAEYRRALQGEGPGAEDADLAEYLRWAGAL